MDGLPCKTFPRATGASRASCAGLGAAAALAILAGAANAQPIDISGVVKDEASGKPLSGFVVSLKTRGLADTTNDNGEFHLRKAAGNAGDRSPLQRLVYSHRHGFALRMARAEEVTAEIRNGAGRTLLHGSYTLKAGDWSLKPRNLEPGLYTVMLWTGTRLRALRLEIPAADKSRGKPEWLLAEMSAEQSLETLTPPSGMVVDSLKLEKRGYLPLRVAVQSWSQGGITVLPKRQDGERIPQ